MLNSRGKFIARSKYSVCWHHFRIDQRKDVRLPAVSVCILISLSLSVFLSHECWVAVSECGISSCICISVCIPLGICKHMCALAARGRLYANFCSSLISTIEMFMKRDDSLVSWRVCIFWPVQQRQNYRLIASDIVVARCGQTKFWDYESLASICPAQIIVDADGASRCV